MAQSKLDFVDVLRGLAILGVVWLHFSSASAVQGLLPESLSYIVELGGHGVQLFFMASAFTLFRSYHHRHDLETQPRRNFFIRRYFRIAPMYYVAIAYFVIQNGTEPTVFLDGTFQNTPINIISNLLFLNTFSPYHLWLVPGSWSVATEMMFYLLVPMLFRYVPDLRSAIRFLGMAVVIRFISWQVFTRLPWLTDPMVRTIYAGWVLPSQLPIFALGILLFFVLRGDEWPKLSRWDVLGWASLIFAEVMTQGGRVFQTELVLTTGFALMAIGFSKLSWDHLPGKVLRHIGKVSFSMYITHWAVIYWGKQLGWIVMKPDIGWNAIAMGYAWRFALVMVATVAVSTLTYQLIEKPGQTLGGRLIAFLDRKTSAEPRSKPAP